MAEFQYNRIKMRLLDEISPHIDLSDLSSGLKDIENQKLSRSVAAAALQIETGIASPEAAAAAVVDGFKDNGIDAIHYDASSKTLFLVQAKWTHSNSSSIDLAGILKFLAGVTDLLSQRKARFSEKIQSRWAIISEALDSAAKIILVIAYPGSSKIDPTIQEKIDEFVQGQNDTSDTFACSVVSQKELFQHFAAEAAPPQIDLAISLAQYGRIESPLLAFYGQISAVEIAKWYREHGNKLFAGNIRHFVGLASDVNAEIAKTLTQQPDNFWYFNNGITILAQDIQRRPGPTDKSVGVFDCKRVTVVNGAQTVGTIGRSNISNENTAVVQARIILVEDPEAQTGRLITRASNTQNRIDARNFVALDSTQERIRSELLLDGVNYEYRVGEPIELSTSSFDFIDAIIALACSSQQVSYVSMAKAYIGGLYTDIHSAPYTALFNGGTNSKRLWMLVQLARRIDQSIRSQFDDPTPATRGIIVHGNRFALHCIYKKLEKIRSLSENSQFGQEEIDNATKDIISNTAKIIDKFYEGAYLAPLFKNVTKCTDIRDKLMSEGVAW